MLYKLYAGIRHISQSSRLHAKKSYLIRRSKPVFERTEDAVVFIAYPLEKEHGIHQMLQDFRSGYCSVFRHVSYEHDARTGLFCIVDEPLGDRPDLDDTASASRCLATRDHADRVDDDQSRAALACRLDDIIEIRERCRVDVCRCYTESFRSLRELSERLLRGDIESGIF